MDLSSDVRGMTLANYCSGYIVTSPYIRGMTLFNYYTGHMVNSPDVRGMALFNYKQATWTLLLILEEWI